MLTNRAHDTVTTPRDRIDRYSFAKQDHHCCRRSALHRPDRVAIGDDGAADTLAAFQNPEFYRTLSMRFPTFSKPRIISCTELHARHVGLPRGCLDEAVELIRGEGADIGVDDLRVIGNALPNRVRFQGTLQGQQVKAFNTLMPHDYGGLATTAFGKTVVAAALIAQRERNALVLVHRRELLTQWVKRLRTFLDIDPKDIGIMSAVLPPSPRMSRATT
jgi:hypothetical protein